MLRVHRSPESARDYRDIWNYIATDNPDAADRQLRHFDRKLEQAASAPGMGAPRDEYVPGLRVIPVGRYLLFYRRADDGVELVRAVHSARNLRRVFQAGR